MMAGMLQARERQRRLMLKEMGITPWIPRVASPTAGQSHEIVFSLENVPATQPGEGDRAAIVTPVPSEQGMPQHSETEKSPAPNKAEAMNQARQLLGQGKKDKAADPKPEPLAETLKTDQKSTVGEASQQNESAQHNETARSDIRSPQANKTDTDPSVAFNFTWVGVDERLALLAMMPEGETHIPASQREMMKRMLVALDKNIDTSNLRARLFRWPLPGFDNQRVSAASSAVNGFVAKQLNDRPAANLLVLSSAVPVFLPQSTPVGQLSVWEPFDMTVLCTHAMHDMESSNTTKREAWQHMQALRQLLISG